MEVSALKYSGGIGLHARSPLLRLQSDERLVALVRRGNASAFEMLVSRYESRLLAFCRHMLGSREDAEDVLQDVLAAAYNAMLADDRPINVKPWLYRIARNRSLNQLRRARAIGVDSMDVHLSDHGQSTADVVHGREEFLLLVGDIHELPETQKTALVLREMDALSYEQIAEAMETTVPSVKSLLVRARVSLAEAAEARLLSCNEVRIELGEIAEGLRKRPSPLVRRHLRSCPRCEAFQLQLKETNRALAALLPLGPLVLLKQFLWAHTTHSAAGSGAHVGAGATGAAAGGGAAGSLLAGTGAGGFISAGVGAIATKAAAGLAAAALLTGAAVEVDHVTRSTAHHHAAATAALVHTPLVAAPPHLAAAAVEPGGPVHPASTHHRSAVLTRTTTTSTAATTRTTQTLARTTASVSRSVTTVSTTAAAVSPPTLPGRTQTQTDPTILAPPPQQTPAPTPPPTPGPTAVAPVVPAPASTSTSTSTSSTTSASTATSQTTSASPPASPTGP